jgi:succinate dehydrogenase hydrophobic anchor subunit
MKESRSSVVFVVVVVVVSTHGSIGLCIVCDSTSKNPCLKLRGTLKI